MDLFKIFSDFFYNSKMTADAESRASHALRTILTGSAALSGAIWRFSYDGEQPLCLSVQHRHEEPERPGQTHIPQKLLLPENAQAGRFFAINHPDAKSLLPGSTRMLQIYGLPLGSEQPAIRFLILGFEKVSPDWSAANACIIASVLGLWLADARHSEDAWQRLLIENANLRGRISAEYGFPKLIGNSHAMRSVYEQVAQVAPVETTILIRGESGTGKELIAEAIHGQSTRLDRPFIRVNCAAIPETLIESEFFGHERGAFTGAISRKKGRFEMADGGTLFLDEIGELTTATQAKLLRVLQEQTFERVGGTEPIRVNVRIVTATNADLEAMISEGSFREDLYYRLNVFSIYLPALRERKTDILLLADHFLFKYARKHSKIVQRISTPAIDALMRYHWPGNVRELENVIERSVLVCQDQVIHGYHLPPTLQTAETSNTLTQLSFTESVSLHEKELIIEALKATRGNRARAARLLQVTERIISYKIRNLGIDVDRYRV